MDGYRMDRWMDGWTNKQENLILDNVVPFYSLFPHERNYEVGSD